MSSHKLQFKMNLIGIICTIISLVFYLIPSTAAAEDNCTCAYYSELEDIGPYCANWMNQTTPFCLLSNKSDAEQCPGATPWMNSNLYWTVDKSVCQKSTNYTAQYCHCEHYKEANDVGPYCAEWWGEEPAWCILRGWAMGRFCPGAREIGENLYWTDDAAVCSSSLRPQSEQINLSVRESLSIHHRVYI